MLILGGWLPQAGEDFGEGILGFGWIRGSWFRGVGGHKFKAGELKTGQAFEALFQLGPGGLGGYPEAGEHGEIPGADHEATLQQAQKDRMALQGRPH